MMKNLVLVYFLFFCLSPAIAQHCPFDGSSIIFLKTISSKKALNKKLPELILHETGNKNPSLCTYSDKNIEATFLPINKFYSNNTHLKDYEKKLSVELHNRGDYFIILSQAETECMKKNNNDFDYTQRKFEVHFVNPATNKIVSISIPKEKIYMLCTNGDWNRITALEIKFEK